MNVYVETNFVLELSLQQEQATNCEDILTACDSGKINLIIPAFCLAESLETLHRQNQKRKELQQKLNVEVNQLSRNAAYKNRLQAIQDIESLLIESNRDERLRFENYRQRLFKTARIIDLSGNILSEATVFEHTPYDLTPQDAVVYATVLSHLKQADLRQCCFLNRNSKDFNILEITNELQKFNCVMIPRFDQGFQFIKKQIDS